MSDTKKRQDQTEYHKQWYQDRVAAGICLRCPAPAVPGTKLCQTCRKKIKAKYDLLKASGLCPRCKTNRPAEGKTTCDSCRAKHRVISQVSYFDTKRERVAEGKCWTCGGDRDDSRFQRCSTCRNKSEKARKIKDDQRKQNHLCPDCGNPVEKRSYTRCKQCRAKRSVYDKRKTAKLGQLQAERKAVGLCLGCGGVREDDRFLYCVTCRVKNKEATKRRTAARREEGVCIECCGERFTEGDRVLCRVCYFKLFAGKHLGSFGRWKELEALWEECEAKCVYSGEPLSPGKTATLDHKTPLCRGGEKTIANLQWVTYAINTMKSTLTHDEFIAFCHDISIRFPDRPEIDQTAAVASRLICPGRKKKTTIIVTGSAHH